MEAESRELQGSRLNLIATLLLAFNPTPALQVSGFEHNTAMRGPSRSPDARMQLTRRSALLAPLAVLAASLPQGASATGKLSKLGYDVTPMSEKEVEDKAKDLTNLQKAVALQAVTERAFTGKTTNGYKQDNKTPGYYVGSVSGLPLFSSKEKYDSGTGWPSFFAPVDDAHVILRQDPDDLSNPNRARMMGGVRTEVLDAKSGAHLGHVFPDGPEPTGKRFCMNAAAMTFVPSPEGSVPPGVQ